MTMTDLEKRKALAEFCKGRRCYSDKCPLRGKTCRCGCGTHFLVKNSSGKYEMTEDEINAAYAIVFPESEPVMTELVEEGPDTLITIAISGERKVSNIEIYFKED